MVNDDDLQLRRRIVGMGIALIAIQGQLDIHTYERLSNLVNQTMDMDCFKLIIDLSGVDHLASPGIGIFVGALEKTRSNGGNLILLKPQPRIVEVLRVLGLAAVFPVADSLEDALTAYEWVEE